MPRKWLQQAIETDYLPAIKALKDTIAGRQQAEALNRRIRQDWHDRGSRALTQQQGLMDDTRKAIKDALSRNHWSLGYIQFSPEEHTEINNIKQNRVAERNEATQQLNNPDEIVGTAVGLLESPEWASIAAGLATLTGRRVAEILSTAKFIKKTQWSVIFTGALKRRGETVKLSFEIPTLTTADRIITALSRLRAELPEATEMEPTEINKKYEQAVARSCAQAFAGLVPSREGKDSLYSHLFRAIYATIATFWYCPPSVNETEFKAAIQGHYALLDEKNPDLRRSLAASRHYSDYEISDREIAHYNGKRKGIKLGVGGIEPIEQFKTAMKPKHTVEHKKRASIRIWYDDKLRLEQLLKRFEGTQQERIHALLNWLESLEAIPNLPPQTRSAPTSTHIAEDIPMRTQINTTELDEAELDTPSMAIATTLTGSSPLEAKMDQLLGAITQLIQVQTIFFSSAQPADPIKPARAIRPKLVQVEGEKPTIPDKVGKATNPRTNEASRSQTRAGAMETTERIHQAIDAIIAYNNASERKHVEKWAIGINTLKAFAGSQEAIVAVIGGKNRKKELVTGTRQTEIEEHHRLHQINPNKHNYHHRGKTEIRDMIKI
jgi:Telomere resolvase